MYHNIGFESGFNTLAVKDFQDHLEYLKNNYFVVSLDDYMKLIRGKKTKKVVAITFDDAYHSLYTIVLPLLKKYRFPSTVFVPVSYVGQYNEWDHIYDKTRIDILSWEKINKLNEENLITIGSHGYTHISLGQCGQDKIYYEIVESKRVLENKLNARVKYFAYPYGQIADMNAISKKALLEANYEAACSTLSRRKNRISDQFQLNRIEILSDDTSLKLKNKMERIPDKYYCKQIIKNVLYRMRIKN